jgi:tRNA uridine 5-carboxymethylaminomethyl modification enzyme
MPASSYDIIVIGGGHAGAEAAWSAGILGANTALITFDAKAIGRLSCNPAIGGIGKGQMVREIDALGGLMGLVTDEAGIQFRMLNRRKGPAVWAPRAQVDDRDYPATLQRWLSTCPDLTILTAGVERITYADQPAGERSVTGVQLADGTALQAKAIIVTSGTFLRGLMHTGERQTQGGRVGEAAANGLSASLAELGLTLGRLKTGTPPRLNRDTIDYDQLATQAGDEIPRPFSFLTNRIEQPQIQCWIAYTNAEIHNQIRANLHRAPMYSGQIDSTGPRYCPSIEDKIVRFADKDRHQLFLEPEGRHSQRIYANGISTSLPEDVQRFIIANIPGLERAEILQLGYAVEYDYVPPEQIGATLMTKRIRGLFLAGQINGTSGYEEAAGQGQLAGINAARFAAGQNEIVLGRDQAYIGVMVDDLVTRGVLEPYRMFTSRAEHRLHLRYDNADSRLTPLGRELGLVSGERWEQFEQTQAILDQMLKICRTVRVAGRTLEQRLGQPDADIEALVIDTPQLAELVQRDRKIWERALVQLKYAGYIARQLREIDRFHELEDRAIPADLDYRSVKNLRQEAIDRFMAVRPRNLGQASRISGIHPTDVTVLMLQLHD